MLTGAGRVTRSVRLKEELGHQAGIRKDKYHADLQRTVHFQYCMGVLQSLHDVHSLLKFHRLARSS